jgi:hypothetical protein
MARKGTTETVELIRAVRLNNSVNGNGRFRLVTMEGDYVTQSDSACSGDVENIVRKIPHGESITVTLGLTPAGRVWSITS